MTGDMYIDILSMLKEHYDKDPLFFVPSSELRSKLGFSSVDELRPYAENLEMNYYVYKEEGFSPTFLLKIRKKGCEALKAGKVDIQRECKLHGPEKIKILEMLNKDAYYVGKHDLIKELGLDENEVDLIADEMSYCGLAKRIGASSGFTLKITNEGKEYLKANKK